MNQYLASKMQNFEDVRQQAALNLLEKGNEFIFELKEKGKLNNYFFISCININKNNLKKNCKIVYAEIIEDSLIVENYEETSINFELLEQDYWYKSKVLELSTDVNIRTTTALNKQTNIPYKSLVKSITNIKQKIKENGEKYIKRINTSPNNVAE